jgi:hypothetical protein
MGSSGLVGLAEFLGLLGSAGSAGLAVFCDRVEDLMHASVRVSAIVHEGALESIREHQMSIRRASVSIRESIRRSLESIRGALVRPGRTREHESPLAFVFPAKIAASRRLDGEGGLEGRPGSIREH